MFKFLLIFAALLLACGEQNTENGTDTQNQDQMQNQPQANMSQTPDARHGMPSWAVPEGWVEEQPSSSMRKAQFRLPKADGDSEDASVVIFYFGGEGGGAMANMERWAGQFKQPDGSSSQEAAETKKSTVNGLKHTTIDVSGIYQFRERPMAGPVVEKPGFRMIATVVETSTGPWFVKFVGPEATVEKWESSFHDFMNSFKM